MTLRLCIALAALAISANAQQLRFEVASVKASKDTGGRGGLEPMPGGGLKLTGVTLKSLIAFAYDLQDTDVSGGPGWVSSQGWDILARPEKAETEMAVAPGTTAWDRTRLRTQTLIDERFHVKFHKNSRQVSAYTLVPKGEPKVKESATTGNARTMRSYGRIDAQRGSMKMLCAVLTNMLGKLVVDGTGLTGVYDYTLEYQQEGPIEGETLPSDVPKPSIFTALQEQLGLKLENSKTAFETIVIDHAEKASNN